MKKSHTEPSQSQESHHEPAVLTTDPAIDPAFKKKTKKNTTQSKAA